MQQRFGDNVPCLDTTGADIYLNREDVQNALHIAPGANKEWGICSATLNYTALYPDLSPVYQQIFSMDDSIYALVYNGDTDLSCNFLLDQWFVDDLNPKPMQNSSYREWFYSDSAGQQVGGWTIEYDRITVVTVRGSGHMVPQYRPNPALQMFQHFLTRTPL